MPQKHPLRRTIRRHTLQLFTIFSVVCSLIFLGIPFLERRLASESVPLRDSADQFETLLAEAGRLADEERTICKKMDAHRLAHRDPNGVLAQFDKISVKLDDQRERLQFMKGQMTRLRAAVAAEKASTEPVRGGMEKPMENDPEVLTILAQIQLLDEQVAEQFRIMCRTEQHPYVMELRAKESELQKRLAFAKERAKPMTAMTREWKNKTIAELQLEILLADQGTLESEVERLAAQRDQLQKKTDELLSVRQEFEELTERLTSVRKEHEAIEAELAKLELKSGTLSRLTGLEATYGLGAAIAFVMTILWATVVHQCDSSMHTLEEASSVIDLTILGMVSNIRSPAQRKWQHLWRSVGRPMVVVACMAMVLGSAWFCYDMLLRKEHHAVAWWLTLK